MLKISDMIPITGLGAELQDAKKGIKTALNFTWASLEGAVLVKTPAGSKDGFCQGFDLGIF